MRAWSPLLSSDWGLCASLFSGRGHLDTGVGLEGGGILVTTKIPLPITHEPFIFGGRKHVVVRGARGQLGFLRLHSLPEQGPHLTPISTPSCPRGGPDLCKPVMESNHRVS